MPGQLRPRALVALVAVLLAAAGAALGSELAFSRSVHSCYAQTLGVEMMTFGNRTYCGQTVSVEGPEVLVNSTTWTYQGPTMNTAFLGFAFTLTSVSAGLNGWLNVTIIEPNGTSYHGGPFFGGPYPAAPDRWFTPDEEAGVYEPGFMANVTLLVEVGA